MSSVLVVDNDAVTGHCLASLFRLEGHQVQAFTNPARVIDLLKDFTPDLIVLDVMMPEVNGLDLLRQIRQDSRLKPIRIVMYSAVTDLKAAAIAYSLGASDYIQKGTPWDDLRARIEQYLN